MASAPPPYPPPYPPPGYDPRDQRRAQRYAYRAQRDQMRAQQDMLRYQMRGLRRSSVLGPLLLIVIGIVFLLVQTGRVPRDRFWEWYGHWWPVLLVVAGVILLAEWAFDQFMQRDPSQPQYRRSVGGSVFLLFLVFSITGVFVHGFMIHPPNGSIYRGFGLNPDSMDEFLGDKHESDQSLDLALPAGSSLAVINPHGDVTVNGTSDDGRVHIAIHKQVYTRTDSEADSKAQQLTPATSTFGSTLTVTMHAVDGAHADLILTVPAAAASSVTADHGDIHIASIKAGVTVIANHGDVELSAISGPATAHINSRGSSISAHSMGNSVTLSGRAEDINLADVTGPVTINGDFYGTTRIERIASAIHFHTSRTDLQLARLDGEIEVSGSDLSARQALGPVVLTTNHENITLDRIAGDVAVTNRNGSIDLTAAPSLGSINLEDRNGSVKVVMPDHAGFYIQADTTNGEINTSLPVTAVSQGDASRGSTQSNRNNHKTVTATVAPGGPVLHISTTNGDISIEKATVAAIPSVPPIAPKLTLSPPVTHVTKSQTKAQD